MSLQINPLSTALGMEVTGLDLAQPIENDTVDQLKASIHENLVLVFRNQDLSPAQLLNAVGLFGDLMTQHMIALRLPGHPEIVTLDSRNTKVGGDGKFVPIGARDWHVDHAHQERPPNFTALYAVKLPTSGGDTSFANMQKGFAALPESRRNEVSQKIVETKMDDRYSEARDVESHLAPQQHPLARTHPVTGKKAIYFHPGMTENLQGMTHEESLAYLDELLEQVLQPEIIYRHQWQPGDLVLMDNRGQMHVGHPDYDFSQGRVLYRVMVKGEKAF